MKRYMTASKTSFALLLTAALLAFSPSCKKDPKAPVVTYNAGDEPPTLTFTANGVSFEMVEVEGGTFWMGAQSTDPSGQNYDSEAFDNEQPVHQVTLSNYHIGKFEVTQQLWQAVMGGNPSRFTGDSQRPVEQVNWDDCQDFITALNELCANQLNGKHFALPTEAQWEFAARGGKQNHDYKYSGSNTISDVAWYYDNSGSTTHAVGKKTLNELGLYDMSGNVWEWCSDWYVSYGSSAQTNPTGPSSGSYRVCRGGSWSYNARGCRVSNRNDNTPEYTRYDLGLRLALVTDENSNLLLPTVTTSQVSDITQVSAVSGGNVTDDGGSTVTERGICWSTSHNPTTSGNHANSGTGTGSFSVQMTGLTPGTTYYVRAYAKNSAGTVYGNEVSFTTSQNISVPTVTTSQVTNITQTTATGGGNVTSDGGAMITEKGVCWSENPIPTINDFYVQSGMGLGEFAVSITMLEAGKLYYCRAYAINSVGVGYGEDVMFNTSALLSGDGTLSSPYDVASGITLQGQNVVAWVQGYIVGAVKSGISTVASNADINWAAPFDLYTNVLIADDPTCKEFSSCVIVNLPSGKPLRSQVNLVDNPGNLGKLLAVNGTLRFYFGQAGLRDSGGTDNDFVLEGGSTLPTPGPGTCILSE